MKNKVLCTWTLSTLAFISLNAEETQQDKVIKPDVLSCDCSEKKCTGGDNHSEEEGVLACKDCK